MPEKPRRKRIEDRRGGLWEQCRAFKMETGQKVLAGAGG